MPKPYLLNVPLWRCLWSLWPRTSAFCRSRKTAIELHRFPPSVLPPVLCRKLYRNFNRIGVCSFVLSGAPIPTPLKLQPSTRDRFNRGADSALYSCGANIGCIHPIVARKTIRFNARALRGPDDQDASRLPARRRRPRATGRAAVAVAHPSSNQIHQFAVGRPRAPTGPISRHRQLCRAAPRLSSWRRRRRCMLAPRSAAPIDKARSED